MYWLIRACVFLAAPKIRELMNSWLLFKFFDVTNRLKITVSSQMSALIPHPELVNSIFGHKLCREVVYRIDILPSNRSAKYLNTFFRYFQTFVDDWKPIFVL